MSGDDFVEVMDFYRDSIVEAATQKRPRHLSQNYESGIHVKIEDALPDIYPGMVETMRFFFLPIFLGQIYYTMLTRLCELSS